MVVFLFNLSFQWHLFEWNWVSRQKGTGSFLAKKCEIMFQCLTSHDGSMWLANLPTWMVDFYGFHVYKYTFPHRSGPWAYETSETLKLHFLALEGDSRFSRFSRTFVLLDDSGRQGCRFVPEKHVRKLSKPQMVPVAGSKILVSTRVWRLGFNGPNLQPKRRRFVRCSTTTSDLWRWSLGWIGSSHSCGLLRLAVLYLFFSCGFGWISLWDSLRSIKDIVSIKSDHLLVIGGFLMNQTYRCRLA